jgi:hypothetical protein
MQPLKLVERPAWWATAWARLRPSGGKRLSLDTPVLATPKDSNSR